MDAVKPYTFIVQKTKNGKVVLVTTSAVEVEPFITSGHRVEIWLKDKRLDTLYSRTRDRLSLYHPPSIIAYNRAIISAIKAIEASRRELTTQQYKTLKGQALAGSAECALKGLQKIKRRMRNDCIIMESARGSGRGEWV